MTKPIFSGVNHLCVVTRDVDRTIRVWADKYGVGPWNVYTYGPSTIKAEIDGAPVPFGMRVGMAHLDPTTRIEIIQPTDELSPYAESLTARGDKDHLHHVRLDVADYDESMGKLAGLGLGRVLSGLFLSGNPDVWSSADYFDTEGDLGFIAEVANLPEGYALPTPDYVYPDAAG